MWESLKAKVEVMGRRRLAMCEQFPWIMCHFSLIIMGVLHKTIPFSISHDEADAKLQPFSSKASQTFSTGNHMMVVQGQNVQ